MPQIRAGEYEGLQEKVGPPPAQTARKAASLTDPPQLNEPLWAPDFGPASWVPSWGGTVTGVTTSSSLLTTFPLLLLLLSLIHFPPLFPPLGEEVPHCLQHQPGVDQGAGAQVGWALLDHPGLQDRPQPAEQGAGPGAGGPAGGVPGHWLVAPGEQYSSGATNNIFCLFSVFFS